MLDIFYTVHSFTFFSSLIWLPRFEEFTALPVAAAYEFENRIKFKQK